MAIIFDLRVGSMNISINDIFNSIFNFDSNNVSEVTARIFRFPRVISAVLVGICLSISGLFMQTLFQNPLAGPYVLGINSGSSFMVAVITMTGFGLFTNSINIVSAAMLGAFLCGMVILLFSFYIKNKVSLLLVGIMIGSFLGAMVSVIQSYSSPDNLKLFMFWSFGSLNHIELAQIPIFSIIAIVGLGLSFLLMKPLSLLSIGEENAIHLGVNLKFTRFSIIIITAVLTGVCTAFCGPIAFVGLIVPNIVKRLYRTSNYSILLVGVVLLGSLLVVLCDIAMNLLHPFIYLPLNAMTSILGAPVVIWIILKKIG